jgi:hypothetical protein
MNFEHWEQTRQPCGVPDRCYDAAGAIWYVVSRGLLLLAAWQGLRWVAECVQ